MCPGIYNGPYGNWSMVTNPCSLQVIWYMDTSEDKTTNSVVISHYVCV